MTAPSRAGLRITGGVLLDPVSGEAGPADLLLSAAGRVLAITGRGRLPELATDAPADDAGQIDATGLLIAAGLVDLQVNGAAGIDLTAEPERVWEVAAALPRHGVTSFLPTLVTTDPATRSRALAALAAGRPDSVPSGATPLGWHFEGPMLAPSRAGAHDRALLRAPSPGLIDGWSAAAGVLMVTLAPELPGAVEVIRLLVARGVLVSLGHTEATLEQVDAATEAGARAVTHLYNAMPPLGSRVPGPVGAVLGGDALVAGLIVDGLHVHPRTVAATWRALGRDRFLAVSDTTAALDQPDGEAWLGGRRIRIQDGAARLASDPGGSSDAVLAGSAVGLAECLRLLARFTAAPPASVLPAATTVPAALLDRPDVGRLTVGGPADAVLFTPDLFPQVVVTKGVVHATQLHTTRKSPPSVAATTASRVSTWWG